MQLHSWRGSDLPPKFQCVTDIPAANASYIGTSYVDGGRDVYGVLILDISPGT